MKQYLYRLSIILLVLVLLTFTGCGNTDPFAETNKLVVYVPPTMNYEAALAQGFFKQQYPNVEVEYVTFGKYADREAWEAFQLRLKTELLAGKGPDVVLFDNNTFPDLYKVMDSGTFVDLEPYMEADSTFDASQYLPTLLNAGVYKEQRLFVPMRFAVSYLFTDRTALQQKGISLPASPDFAVWSEQVANYMNTAPTQRVENDVKEWFRHFRMLFVFSGLQVVDYETRELVLDDEQLRSFAAFCKALYPYPAEAVMDGLWEGATESSILTPRLLAVKDGSQLLENLTFLPDVAFYLNNQAPELPDTLYPFPSMEGENTIAIGKYYVAVNAAAANPLNAYRFLRTFMDVDDPGGSANNELRRDQLVKSCGEDFVNALEDVGEYPGVRPLQYYENYSNAVMEMVCDALEPYYQDAKSFDDCVADLRNTLELYLHE